MRLYLSSFRNGNKPQELIRLLDGRRTAVIHNAQDFLSDDERAAGLDEEMERLASIGLDPVELDLRDYFGDSESLKATLEQFDLVWVRGGNTFILRRAFKQSGADKVIHMMLTEDTIAYGGYSAGVDMITPSLHGSELVDDAYAAPEGYDTEIIWECLGLVPYAVAPHYKSDHPESSDIDKSIEYLINHHTPFIALRDGEVIIVDKLGQKIVS